MKRYIKSYTNSYHDGAEWAERNYKLYIDGEMQTFTQYFRNIDDYRVEITPKYFKESDFLGYEVVFYPYTLDKWAWPTTTEVFETFYDAMDYVDSGELARMYF